MKQREILFEYGFKSVNGIVKKIYHLHEIPTLVARCDVLDVLPIVYVRQFTGILDRNGVRVFEGDIVRYRGGKKPRNAERPFINGLVVYDKTMFTIENNKSIWIDSAVLHHVEIVGNIHQNPELL